MPKPNANNPVCPVCGKYTTYNLTTASGAKQYRCRRHKPNYTCTDSDRPAGGQCISDAPMTNAERHKRHRESDPAYREKKNKRRRKKKID